MRVAGRKSSSNVEDRRSYFGTLANDPDYPNEDRYADFAKASILHPYLDGKPQKFKKGSGMSISDMITSDTVKRLPPGKKVFGLNLTAGNLFPTK